MLQVFATSADYGLDPVWEASTEFGLNDPKTDKVGLHCIGEKAQNPSEIASLRPQVGCSPLPPATGSFDLAHECLSAAKGR